MLVVEGICDDVQVGSHIIEVKTHYCNGRSAEMGTFLTGWQSSSRMHIEEIRLNSRMDAGQLHTPIDLWYYDREKCGFLDVWNAK